MDVCFVAATKDMITEGTVPEKDGQFIVSVDSPEVYYDFGGERRHVSGSQVKVVSELPTSVADIDKSTIYALKQSDESHVVFYVYDEGDWRTHIVDQITEDEIQQWWDQA